MNFTPTSECVRPGQGHHGGGARARGARLWEGSGVLASPNACRLVAHNRRTSPKYPAISRNDELGLSFSFFGTPLSRFLTPPKKKKKRRVNTHKKKKKNKTETRKRNLLLKLGGAPTSKTAAAPATRGLARAARWRWSRSTGGWPASSATAGAAREKRGPSLPLLGCAGGCVIYLFMHLFIYVSLFFFVSFPDVFRLVLARNF